MPPPVDDDAWQRRLRRGAVLVAALSIATIAVMIALGGGLAAVLDAIARLPPWAIAAAVGCTLLEWVFDAARFAVAGRAFDVSLPFVDWLKIALANLSAAYAANVGPAASAYVIVRRTHLSAGDALALALGKQLLFVPAALVPALAVAALAPPATGEAAVTEALQVTGLVAVGVVAIVLLLGRGRVRALIRRRAGERAAGEVDRFTAGMRRFFVERPRWLAASIGLALLNQAAIVATVAALAAGFGAPHDSLWRTALLFSTLSQIAPTPGGAGVTEAGGALLYRGALAASPLVGFMVIARFLTIQLPILVGGLLLARLIRSPAWSQPPSRRT